MNSPEKQNEAVLYDKKEIQSIDPRKALEGMAVAEVAEKYYRQARDLEGLRKAIEAIWTARHDFVAWWDATKPKGRPEEEKVDRTVNLSNFNLSPKVVSRWRQKVADDEKLALLIQAHYYKAAKIINPDALTDKHTGDEESYTPRQYIESARTVMGSIDLDPASNEIAQMTVKAGEFYTLEDDGLSFEWQGNVWLNPPYTTRIIDKFVAKLVTHRQRQEIQQAILLTNNNTDTQWFLSALRASTAICFTTGRINFIKSDGMTSSPTNGQAFFYFGDAIGDFANEFQSYGPIVLQYD